MTSAERVKKWREANPEKARAIQAKYRAKTRDVKNAKERVRNALDPGRGWRNARIRQIKVAGRPPGSHCEICPRAFSLRYPACFDHNHATGAFRGWICRPCNEALGLLQDLPDNLLAAARYLRERGFAAG